MLHKNSHAGEKQNPFADREGVDDGDFRFAFQPIVNSATGEVIGHEALVRGPDGESAASVIAAIRPDHQYAFDQACRLQALQAAGRGGFEGDIHLNCAQITPDNAAVAVAATRECALENDIAPARVVLEFGNLARLGNPRQLDQTRRIARAAGFRVLADNVGSGEVGLKRLAVLRPDYAKVDRSLIQGVDTSPRRQAIVHGVLATCRALGIEVIGTGIEREVEADWLFKAGIRLAQGFYFGHPSYRALPEPMGAVSAA